MHALKVLFLRVICSYLVFFSCFLISYPGFGQAKPDNEALLTFSHPSIGQYYLDVVFFGDFVFLPLGELLSLTGISSVPTSNKFGFQGYYPNSNEKWEIDPLSGNISIGGRVDTLTANDFYLGEQELYLHPRIFSKIFGLEFSVNTLNLSISMKSERVLPIEEKRKREVLRKLVQAKEEGSDNLSLVFPLNRKIFGLGALDYNVIFDKSSGASNLGLQMKAGTALLGGDFQINLTTKRTGEDLISSISGMRWRYVFSGGLTPQKNNLLGSLSLGQITSSIQGSNVSLFGFSLTNKPLVPRKSLNSVLIDGYTEKDSEVELLIGGQLVEFTRADEMGYYRFNAPVNYGTVLLTIRIYTPQGQIIIQERQLQIPFSFLPKGFVTYNIQAGNLMNAPDSLSSKLLTHADLGFGVSNAVTIRTGLDYGEYFTSKKVASSFGLSARLVQKYLIDAEVLPLRHFRVTANVFYGNNVNISARTTEYLGLPLELKTESAPLRDVNLNVFFPFQLLRRSSGIRVGGERIWFFNGYKGNLQVDYNVQLGRVATRINYRSQLTGLKNSGDLFSKSISGNLTSSFTYSLPRNPNLPVYIKGMFLRTQAEFNTTSSKITTINIQLSQTLFKTGRLSVSYNRNFLTLRNSIQLGLLYDFSALRSSSQISTQKNYYSLRQTMSGSFTLDSHSGKLLTSNRDQVNRSAISVRMFVDQNDNGVFDLGEDVIPAKAVRLDKSANMLLGSDGILRITQLQSYWTYKLEVVLNDLPDPTLAPKEKVFGFMADPNQVKSIDIPLYRTGIIEGKILRVFEKGFEGIGGLRLNLNRIGELEPLEVLRTFSDGGFYALGLLPGSYSLEIDQKQLDFMNVSATPDKLVFEVKALAEGDFLEGLTFILNQKIEEDQ